MNKLHYAVLTGSTCGDACWHAREEICRCSCGGKNHGILLEANGEQPVRTRKIGGNFYELIAIIPRPAKGTALITAINQEREAINEAINERFPGISTYAYGKWRSEEFMPVLSRKVTASQAKWKECKALDTEPYYMVWARPPGTKYLQYDDNHQVQYITH